VIVAEMSAQQQKIANIQRELNALGENLAVDGEYGPKTKAALQKHFAPLMRKAIITIAKRWTEKYGSGIKRAAVMTSKSGK
jgi:hypothetical protein